MRLDESVAVGPVLEVLHCLPVGYYNVVVGLHWFQYFSANEAWMTCYLPFPVFPAPFEFFFGSFATGILFETTTTIERGNGLHYFIVSWSPEL